MKEKIQRILAKRVSRTEEPGEGLTPAAVLVPFFCKSGQPHVLLTERTRKVRHHKGQISFPGGTVDETDRDLMETALRETHEEIGIDPADVEVLGTLDPSRTLSDYLITPYVGVIPYPYAFRKNPAEVADLLEVPVSYFLRRSHLTIGPVPFRETIITAEQLVFDGHVIWGATLRILQQVRTVLGEVFSSDGLCP